MAKKNEDNISYRDRLAELDQQQKDIAKLKRQIKKLAVEEELQEKAEKELSDLKLLLEWVKNNTYNVQSKDGSIVTVNLYKQFKADVKGTSI